MRIACLAWGSLVWNPRQLPLGTAWRPDGPALPIEFCRVGDHHELATALCPGAARVPTRWAELRCDDLAVARDKLRQREEIDPAEPHKVGSASGLTTATDPVISPADAFCGQEIADWGRRAGLDAVVWTALPPRFDGCEGRAPTADEAVAYLRSLAGEALEHAQHYVQRVPHEIRTPVRVRIEHDLGWRCRSEDATASPPS